MINVEKVPDFEAMIDSYIERRIDLEKLNQALDFGEAQAKEAREHHGKIGLSTKEYEGILELLGEVIGLRPSLQPRFQPTITRAESLLAEIEAINKLPYDSIVLKMEITREDSRGPAEGSDLENLGESNFNESLAESLVSIPEMRAILKKKIEEQEKLESLGLQKLDASDD